jgi:hypothetical protein
MRDDRRFGRVEGRLRKAEIWKLSGHTLLSKNTVNRHRLHVEHVKASSFRAPAVLVATGPSNIEGFM